VLNIQEVTNLIETWANEKGKQATPAYSFKVFAEIGENRESADITGILKTASAPTEPIQNIKNTNYTFALSFLVPAQRTNDILLNVKSIFGGVISEKNGSELTFSDGSKGLITITEGVPQGFNVNYITGESVPLNFTVKINWSANVVLSSGRHWFIEDMELPFLSESVLLEKDGITKKIHQEQFSKTVMTGATRYFVFELPYENNLEFGKNICAVLQRDILNGNFETEYELKFYDGVIFTEAEPFKTTVSIFRTAKSSSRKPSSSSFEITFTDVTSVKDKVQYDMGILNWEFGNDNQNTQWFTSQASQISFFVGKANNHIAQIKAPNLDSLTITSQVYPNPEETELNVFELANKNYAFIRKHDYGKAAKNDDYYFYRITSARIGANRQIEYDLALDTFQTFMFRSGRKIPECNILRAHLNRWVAGSVSGHIKFNGLENSPLFEREELQNISKRLVKRQYVSFNNQFRDDVDVEKDAADKWLDENVLYWVYFFVDPQHEYEIMNVKVGSTPKKQYLLPEFYINGRGTIIPQRENAGTIAGSVDSRFVACCVPLYKSNKEIKIKYEWRTTGAQTIEAIIPINQRAEYIFRKYNNDNAYYFGYKISAIPPFKKMEYPAFQKYEIDSDGNLILFGDSTDDLGRTRFYNLYAIVQEEQTSTEAYGDAMFVVSTQPTSVTSSEITLKAKLEFSKEMLIGSQRVIATEYNPKLLNSDYYTLNICDHTGNGYEYDLQKLNKSTFYIEYSEPLVPGVTAGYARIKDTDGVYIADCADNYTGLVTSTDMTLTLATSQYQQMLANNKNFYSQNADNLLQGIITAIGGGIGLSGMSNPATALGGTALGLLGLGIKYKNVGKTVDNMKSAPSQIQKASTSALMNIMVDRPGIYVEEYQILPNEQQMVNDEMFKNGFAYNRIDQIDYYINTRRYFNYIQAEVEDIQGVEMSNTAKQDLITRFANGIRMWNRKAPNSDYYLQYELENYENNLP
jgi:hypothetical protein